MAISRKYGATTLKGLVTGRVGGKIPIQFGGRSSSTDGRTLFVADLPEAADPNVRLTAEVHAYHEAQHVAELRELVVKPRNGIKSLKTMLKKATDPFEKQYHGLAMFVNNALEDIRIDCKANDLYPGTTRKYREADEWYWTNHMQAGWGQIDKVRKLLFMLMNNSRNAYYVEHLLNPIDFQYPVEDVEAYDAVLKPFEDRVIAIKSYDDVVKIGTEIVQELMDKSKTPPPEEEEQGEGDQGDGEPGDGNDPGDEGQGQGDSTEKDGGSDDSEGDPGSDSGDESDEDSDDGGSSGGDEDDTGGGGDESSSEDEGAGDDDETEGSGGGDEKETGTEEDDTDGDTVDGGESSDEESDTDSGKSPTSGDEDEGEDSDDSGGGSGNGEDADGGDDSDGQGEDDADGQASGTGNAERHLTEEDLENTDTSDTSSGILVVINEEAQGFYSTGPYVRDEERDVCKKNSTDVDWGLQGKPYTAGQESKLRQLMKDENAPRKRGGLRKGKRLDGHSVHRYRDIKLGKEPRIWQQTLRGINIETAVMFSIDESGSMAGQEWKTAVKITTALTRVLDTCSVKYAIAGWTSDPSTGRWDPKNPGSRTDNVLHRWYHRWLGRLNQKSFPYDPAGGYTPSAAGLEKALEELDTRTEARRVLLFFTDGAPGTNSTSAEIQTAYMAEQVEMARRRGIHCFGFGIGIQEGSGCSRTMEEVFGNDWVPLPEFDDCHAREYSGLILSKLKETLL